VTGASWVRQSILARHASADLEVYAVWMPMLPTDSRSEWDASVLADPRVSEFWDEDLTLGSWLADSDHLDLGFGGPVVWDAYLLFGPEARWEERPTHLVGFGSPVIGRTSELRREVEPLLDEE
jgi:hypothetical protein